MNLFTRRFPSKKRSQPLHNRTQNHQAALRGTKYRNASQPRTHRTPSRPHHLPQRRALAHGPQHDHEAPPPSLQTHASLQLRVASNTDRPAASSAEFSEKASCIPARREDVVSVHGLALLQGRGLAAPVSVATLKASSRARRCGRRRCRCSCRRSTSCRRRARSG